jgi:ketosteroid isomerase-like protein
MSDSFHGFSSSEDAEDAFYEALQQGDASAVMQIWAEEDEIICIHPNGPRLQGWNAVGSSWVSILENGGIEVNVVKKLCTISDALAIHNVIEEVVIRGAKTHEVVRCYATNVYVREPSGWQMIMHHAAPAADDDAAPSSAGEVLH